MSYLLYLIELLILAIIFKIAKTEIVALIIRDLENLISSRLYKIIKRYIKDKLLKDSKRLKKVDVFIKSGFIEIFDFRIL